MFIKKLLYIILFLIGIRLILQLFYDLDKTVFVKNLIVFVIIWGLIFVLNRIKHKI